MVSKQVVLSSNRLHFTTHLKILKNLMLDPNYQERIWFTCKGECENNGQVIKFSISYPFKLLGQLVIYQFQGKEL